MDNLKIKIEYVSNGFKLEMEGDKEVVREEFKKIKEEGLGNILGNVDLKFEPTEVVTEGHALLQGRNQNILPGYEYPGIMDIVMKNKPKSEVEWIVVYSFYGSDFGKNFITRNTISEQYEKSKRNSKSNIANLSTNFKSAVGQDYLKFLNDTELLITDKGIVKAKEIITREPGSSHISHSVPKSAVSKSESKKAPSGGMKFLGDLALKPLDEESLRDFYKKYKADAYMEKNLLFCYYLAKKIKVQPITLSHIYTCYKEVSERVPGNLYQSLADTKKRKAWIDTKNIDDIRLTIRGEEWIEHDMPKAISEPQS